MELTKLIHRRILIKDQQRYSVIAVTEVKVLEVSPSQNWVKLMSSNGNKYWKASAEIALIEVLVDLKAGKPKVNDNEDETRI